MSNLYSEISSIHARVQGAGRSPKRCKFASFDPRPRAGGAAMRHSTGADWEPVDLYGCPPVASPTVSLCSVISRPRRGFGRQRGEAGGAGMMDNTDEFIEWLYGVQGGGSEQRPHHVLSWAENLEDHEGVDFWRVMIEFWSGFDLIPHHEFSRLFLRFADTAPGYNGGQQVVVFRGQDEFTPLGVSWTESRDVAEGFARGHRGILNRYPIICQFTATEREIAFTCDDRDEAEIVLFVPPVRNVVRARCYASFD